MMKVWLSDRLRCLHPKKLINGELRTIITVMYILMLLMQSSWGKIKNKNLGIPFFFRITINVKIIGCGTDVDQILQELHCDPWNLDNCS